MLKNILWFHWWFFQARPILQRLFYDDTVEEWLAKNMNHDSLASNVDQAPSVDGVQPAITWD